MRILILLLALYVHSDLLAGLVPSKRTEQTVDCLCEKETDLEEALANLPATLYIQNTTIDVDIPVNHDQLCQLLGIGGGAPYTPRDLHMACFYLRRWGIFSRCSFQIIPVNIDEWSLKLTLVGQWRLRSICFEGVLFGKDQIKYMYGLPIGQPFDEARHEEALDYIKNFYRQHGYIKAEVTAKVTRSSADKYVDVKICVHKGRMFRVGGVSADIVDSICDDSINGDAIARSVAKRCVHTKYNAESVNLQGAYIKRYLAKRGYPFAKVKLHEAINKASRRVYLRFDIVLGARQDCAFRGNRTFSRRQLLECLMRGRDVMWNVSGPLCVQELCDYYKRFGFWNVDIQLNECPDEWIFSIDEGDRARIVDVSIKGLTDLSEHALRKLVRPLTKRQYYDEELVESVKGSIVSFLKNQGFWDATIVKTVPVPISDNSTAYRLMIYVDEGVCQNIMRIEIPEYSDLMQQGPFARFNRIRDPLPLKMSYLEDQSKWLRSYFNKLGYRQVRIKSNCVQEDGGIVLQWIVTHDRSKILFGRPIIRTNRKSYNLIDREVCFAEGETWSRCAIEKTFTRLTRLGIFDDVHVYPSGDVDPCGQQPIVVDAHIDQPFEIKTRIGYQQVSRNFIWRKGSTYRVGGSFIYKNPTNNADILRIDGDFTRYQRKSEISYSVPWTFGLPIRTVIKGYSNMFDQPIYIGKKNTVYEALQDGGLMSFQYKSDCVNTAFNIGAEGVKITDISNRLAQVIDFAPVLVGKRIPYFYAEPYFFYESLNDKLNPSRGFITLLTAKVTVPGDRRAAYFVKILAEQAVFVPFAQRIVGAARIRIGHIFTDNFRAVVPPERFYLGGANSVRSYLPDFAPPLGRVTTSDGCVCCVPQGGDTMFNLNLELRVPIWGELTGVVFGDAGLLTKPESSDPLSQSVSSCCTCCTNGAVWDPRIVAATGCGLRYHTPIGPLRFDIGWKPYRVCNSESRFAWFLTLGQSF